MCNIKPIDELKVSPIEIVNLSAKINNNLILDRLDGMHFNIIKDEWSISRDTSINYISKFIKD